MYRVHELPDISLMDCKCGGMTTNIVHEVTTLKVAQMWDSSVVESDLPITIDNHRCNWCKRELKRIFKHNKETK